MKRLISLIVIGTMLFSCIAVCPEQSFAADKSTYWLKVNKSCNVVNVYKKCGNEYVPYKAMICSTGKKGSTPTGNFTVKKRWKWRPLFGAVYGKYTTQFKGNYLFHSVPYKKKKNNKIKVKEYNKLGSQASKGCVRLSTMDARWIYYNCPKGTKVTVYKSSDPGPFGKPPAMKMSGKYGYDPTNPDEKSKCRLTGPEIRISSSKKDTIEWGESINLREGVTARSPYSYQDLTSSIGVTVYKYDEAAGTYVKLQQANVDSTSPGKYQIIYSCHDEYCGYVTQHASFYLTVLEKEEPEDMEESTGELTEETGEEAPQE